MINEKVFHLDELGQAIVFTLKNHEDRITDTEENIEDLKSKIKVMQHQIDLFIKKNESTDLNL